MVHVDASQDYYADLELPLNCTTEDIRKQYRKLAFKYHPDRNPGKEVEYNARFQALGAANEILGDPEQRYKYDASRKRANLGSSSRPAPSRRGNPYQATSDFPPPPRRTGPRAGTDAPPTPNSGSERYTNFPTPPPRSHASSAKQDANARANMFNAWQHMNNAQKTQAQRTQGFTQASPPQSAQWRPGDGSRSRKASDAVPHSSAFEEVHRQHPGVNRTASNRMPRRSAFDSDTSTGAETPAAGSSYPASVHYDRTNHPRMQNGFPPPPPPRGQAPTARRPDPMSHLRSRSGDEAPFTEGQPRVSTPYTTQTGEKTYMAEKSYFTTEALRRSASTRDSAKLHERHDQFSHGAHFEGQPGRHRSASPSPKATVNNQQNDPNDDRPMPRYAGHHQKQQPADAFRPFIVYSSSEESGEGSSSPPESPSNSEVESSNRRKAQPSPSWTKTGEPSLLGKSRSHEEQEAGGTGIDGSRDVPSKGDSIFTFPSQPDPFARNSNAEIKRNNAQNIDTSFSRTEGTSPFTGNGEPTNDIPRTEGHASMSPLRGQYPPRPPQPSPTPNEANNAQTFSQMPSPLSSEVPLTSPGDGTFSADEWARNLQEDNWASRWAHATSTGRSPQRPPPNSKRTRGPSIRISRNQTTPPVPQPASGVANMEDEATQNAETFNSSNISESPSSKDSNAMDIDPGPTQFEERRPSVNSEANPARPAVRQVAVEPTRQEWRENGLNGNGRQSVQDGYLPPPSMPPPPRMPSAPSRRSSNIALGDFKHVAPFSTESTGGIRNLNDLSSSLPFQSQPSSAHPSRPMSLRIELPKPPRAPPPPSTLTKASWNYHLLQMMTYMTAWNQFYAQMVGRFQDRAVQLAEMEKGPAGGMVEGWLGAVGETEALGGWETYVKAMKDDERLRAHLTVACEHHKEAVERHGRLRNQILRGGMAA